MNLLNINMLKPVNMAELPKTIHVLHRLDGIYELDASELKDWLPYEFTAKLLDAMLYRAKVRGFELCITEEVLVDPEAFDDKNKGVKK